MGTSSPESLVLEEGKSSDLTQCLNVVQEATVYDDNKYSEKTCRELARIIVCRTYAPVIHELFHLVVIAAHGGSYNRRYEGLFWDTGAARAGNFRTYLTARPWDSTPVSVDIGEASVSYKDKPFAVSYGRMPLLSALMEFLMTALGYTPLDEAIAPLMGKMPSAADVSDAAKNMSRRLYAYLQDHLPPVQEQKKNRSFLAFAAERGGGTLTAQSLDDEFVMDYWISHSDGTEDQVSGIDARTFRSVFEAAARLISILRYAEEKYRMGEALPIGTNREAGEVDPEDFEQAIGEIDESDDLLGNVNETIGDEVKFLNKRELEILREAVHVDTVARALPRSILRNAVFGQAQARLTQAQRGKPKKGEIDILIGQLPNQNYTARLEDYRALVDHMDRMLLAGLYVLASKGRDSAITLALKICPELDLTGIALDIDELLDADDDVISFQAATARRQFFSALLSEGGGAIEGLGADARAAFKAISRKGFSDTDISDEKTTAPFFEGTTLLLRVRRELMAYLETHAASIDWDVQFDTDKPAFIKQFSLLYGDQNG